MVAVATLILLAVLFSTAAYVRRRVGSQMSLTLVLFGALLFIHGLPLLVYLNFTGPNTFIYERALAPVDRAEIVAKLLLAIALMFVSLRVGSELALSSAPRWRRGALADKRLESGRAPRHVISIGTTPRLLLWLVVAGMLGVSISLSHLSHVVEFFRFDGTDLEKTLLRRDEGGSPYYVYNVVLYSIAPFLVMVSWCNDIGHLRRRFPSLLTGMLFCAVMLGKFGTLSKAPPVIFMLQLVLMHVLLRSRQVNLRALLTVVVSAIVLFVAIIRLTFPELDLSATLSFLYYRALDIPNESLLEYFAAIPASLPYGYVGALAPLFGGASPPEHLPTYFLVAEITRGSVLSSSNAMFVGDAWAQLSWPGVVLASMAVGYVIRLIDLYARRNGYTDQTVCLVAGCTFGIFTILSTSFTTGLVTGGLAFVPLVSTLFLRRARRRPLIDLGRSPLP